MKNDSGGRRLPLFLELTMQRFSLLLIAIFSISVINAAMAENSCSLSPTRLKATYKVTSTRGDSVSSPTTLMLWRDENKVAHQYPQTNITETWQLIRDTHIKAVRYFDGHKRAIEYQPNERIHGKVEKDFSYRYQLISDGVLAKMVEQETTGEGCNTEVKMTLEDHGQHITLTWLPAFRLIKDFHVEAKGMTREWRLTSLAHPDKEKLDTHSFFAEREAYQSTDYADIGDDHTDPFLTKMVNQGFIEAGASGFYHQDGHAIEGQHKH